MTLPSDRATRAGIARSEIWRVRSERAEQVEDAVAVEEPLQIRIGEEVWATTMRTPGSDHELVAGLLLAEGVIRSALDIVHMAHCQDVEGAATGNVLEVRLAPGVAGIEIESSRRSTLTTSACGVCGRASIDDLLARLAPLASADGFDAPWIASLPAELARAQPNFAHTGGLHAAAIAEPTRGLAVVREDIGRHNAVDKAVGRLLLDRALPARHSVLVVSGRASFEIVQKALSAGISALVSVSAPSSLAIGTATRSGMLLVGFARGGDFNVYAGAERLRALGKRGI